MACGIISWPENSARNFDGCGPGPGCVDALVSTRTGLEARLTAPAPPHPMTPAIATATARRAIAACARPSEADVIGARNTGACGRPRCKKCAALKGDVCGRTVTAR